MEKEQRIKKIIIKRKDDFLTALEKNWRDWALKPITDIFSKLGITANHITYFGFILIFAAIYMYFSHNSIKWQLIILLLAAISDALDGSTARNNNNITIKGTWMDHIRDGMLVMWGSYLIYSFNLLNLEIIAIIWILQIILIWIDSKNFFIKYLENLNENTDHLVQNFSLNNLQASVVGRLQFFFWVIGYGSLLLTLIVSAPILLLLGHTAIILEIIFAALNILESYNKKL